jgi:hypothetical protein
MIWAFDDYSKHPILSPHSRGSRKEQAVILKPIQREFKVVLFIWFLWSL